MSDCLFCKIIAGEIPSKKVYEDEYSYAFYDIHPNAPVHVLVVPKQHIGCLNDLNDANREAVFHTLEVIPKIAKQLGLTNGYRVVNNCGPDASQSVMHLHFHILGGVKMAEKLN